MDDGVWVGQTTEFFSENERFQNLEVSLQMI